MSTIYAHIDFSQQVFANLGARLRRDFTENLTHIQHRGEIQ